MEAPAELLGPGWCTTGDRGLLAVELEDRARVAAARVERAVFGQVRTRIGVDAKRGRIGGVAARHAMTDDGTARPSEPIGRSIYRPLGKTTHNAPTVGPIAMRRDLVEGAWRPGAERASPQRLAIGSREADAEGTGIRPVHHGRGTVRHGRGPAQDQWLCGSLVSDALAIWPKHPEPPIVALREGAHECRNMLKGGLKGVPDATCTVDFRRRIEKLSAAAAVVAPAAAQALTAA